MDLNCNGRINIMGDNTMKRFEMYDKISLDNKDDFKHHALTGNWAESILSNAFFF